MVTGMDDGHIEGRSTISSGYIPSDELKSAVVVDPASFYGAQNRSNASLQKSVVSEAAPRPLPAPPTGQEAIAGSSHTTYIPPKSTFGDSAYREPELVPPDDEPMPDLVPSAVDNSWDNGEGFDPSAWGSTDFSSALGPANWADTDIRFVSNDGYLNDPSIDGRNDYEEKRWWDVHVVQQRPGPGMLPPLLADELHTADHPLVSVIAIPPDISALPHSESSPGKQLGHSRTASSSSTEQPPTAEEVHEAIPHPHAFYCRKHHGWILLAWRSSSVLPPIADSFAGSEHAPFPNQERRRKTHTCLDDPPFGRLNKTHHFHKYAKAVDARFMSPKYERRVWEKVSHLKQVRRQITIGSDELDSDIFERAIQGDRQSKSEAQMITDAKEEDTRDLLDLYVCCQCSFYVVVSDIIPGVIPLRYIDEYINDKFEKPPLGKTGAQSVHMAWETIMTVIENKLWKGNNRMLSINGKSFQSKVGWSPAVKAIFEAIGFAFVQATSSDSSASQPMLQPTDTDPSTETGRTSRESLLRAWVECGAVLAHARRQFPSIVKDSNPNKLCVKTEIERENYQTAIGAHPDQIKRGQLPMALQGVDVLMDDWRKLGMTPSTYDSDLLHFAYLAQCRCDPLNTADYFQSLVRIVDALKSVADVPSSLDILVGAERSKGRFTEDDLQSAMRVLGFGSDNELRVDYDDEMDEDFIWHAWRDGIRRSWPDVDGASKRRDLNEAFRMIAESRRSNVLYKAWEDEMASGMTPERAYNTLEVPMGVDEEMLITVYNMRVEDQPSSLEKMRDAMRVIAESTRSERLQNFLETGSDPGIVVAPTRPDWPRGLNQLGNTCYLNSLLQYFYTIRDLRDAIAPLADNEGKFMESDKLKDDDLKHHRVGGRIVSRHEVLRSRKFVIQLANLFWHLEHSDQPAVTPTLELAKLALVTSKDEEEDDLEKGGTDSSHSTDATLVDEPVPSTTAFRSSPSPQPTSPEQSSPMSSSVLGKRPRSFSLKKTAIDNEDNIDIEDKEKDGFVVVSKPSGSSTPALATDANEDTVTSEASGTPMPDTPNAQIARKPPALPPRPKTQATGGSDMMFGKQHDVAECMDNCMFQIETALLRLGELSGPDDSSKSSIVKRLFYGKMRQRLSVVPDVKRSKSSVHEREDYFSHLPVNVSEESFDLYDGLSGYFDDVVEFDGSKAKMEVSLVELPPILQIQLQRVQFNRETLQPYKSHAYVKFEESIFMDRFLDDAPKDKKIRSKEIQDELNTCRERLHQLAQGKNTNDFLSKQTVLDLSEEDDQFIQQLLEEPEIVENEISSVRSRISQLKVELEDIWRDENRAEYELTSVFVHRGSSPTFGHYFIYQRWFPDNKDEWFKYNDSDVTLVNKDSVLSDTTGSTANPYLLVFTQKSSQIIQTVQRADRADPMNIGWCA